jgi:hypothetical protein
VFGVIYRARERERERERADTHRYLTVANCTQVKVGADTAPPASGTLDMGTAIAEPAPLSVVGHQLECMLMWLTRVLALLANIKVGAHAAAIALLCSATPFATQIAVPAVRRSHQLELVCAPHRVGPVTQRSGWMGERLTFAPASGGSHCGV